MFSDMDARPWDFQAEECALRACVDRFNNRRYSSENGSQSELEPMDNCVLSVLAKPITLSHEFMDNYEKWLDIEVFSSETDWEQVVVH